MAEEQEQAPAREAAPTAAPAAPPHGQRFEGVKELLRARAARVHRQLFDIKIPLAYFVAVVAVAVVAVLLPGGEEHSPAKKEEAPAMREESVPLPAPPPPPAATDEQGAEDGPPPLPAATGGEHTAMREPLREEAGPRPAMPIPRQPAPAAADAKREAKPAATLRAAEVPEIKGLKNEGWLVSQAGSRWTLQVTGSTSARTVLDYVRRYGLGDDVAYYRSTLKGEPWYVLLYGSFPSRDAAKAAAAKLPPEIRKGGPWPRTMRSVQDTIEKVR